MEKDRKKVELYMAYLKDVQELYRTTGGLRGISQLAAKHNVTHLSKEEFFKYRLGEKAVDFETAAAVRNAVLKRGQDLKAARKPRLNPVESMVDMMSTSFRIIKLEPTSMMPYRYAMLSVSAIDNADEYMANRISRRPELFKILKEQLNDDGLCEYMEYVMPTLCCVDELDEIVVGFAKSMNNGDSYWLAEDIEVLYNLYMISRFLEKKKFLNRSVNC